jgi:hypothetical protein
MSFLPKIAKIKKRQGAKSVSLKSLFPLLEVLAALFALA